MGKYSSYSTRRQEEPEKDRQIHPIWRGVGLAMIVLIPFISYIGALTLLQMNRQYSWFPLPRDLFVKATDPLILIKVILTIAVAFVLYIIFMLITFIFYRVFAPPRYGPFDVPQVSYRGKKSKR